MKKFLLFFTAILFSAISCNAAIDIKYINCMPAEIMPLTQENITLEPVSTKETEFKDINIKKTQYKFEKAYKLGIPFEYIVTNNSNTDIVLNGIDSDWFANKNIHRKSHWNRMSSRIFKYKELYIPFYNLSLIGIDKEKNAWWADFPKNVTIKKGEYLKVKSMGLDFKNENKLRFIFKNGEEIEL